MVKPLLVYTFSVTVIFSTGTPSDSVKNLRKNRTMWGSEFDSFALFLAFAPSAQ